EAALTSVLSQRWRYLFTFVPNLDIDDSVFLHPEEGKREKHGILHSFMGFVDRVLALQGDSPIAKFSLKCKTGVDSDRVNQWICNVLQRGVSDMDLSVDLGYRYQLPSEVFMSRTLVELKIGSGFSIHLQPGHNALPILKTLVLDTIWSYSGQLQMLLSACPALENLNMPHIHWSLGNEIVSSASLKSLTTDSANFLHAFSFDTPNLLCLKYSELVAWDYPLVNLENLVEAQIKLMLTYDQIEELRGRNDDGLEDDVFQKLGKVQKLVRGIRNVQKLYLSPGALQVLALCCQAMPTFENLTFLDIDSSMDIAWQAMPVLLRNTPHLETLVIKGGLLHGVTDKCGDACICISREEKGRSLASCPVKRLEIRWFEGITREMEMIKHFYDYFPCLEEMEIHVKDGRPRFLAPRVPDSDPYKDLSGRNVKVKVHGSLHRLWTAQ
ncbi:unnamed protein product, partial [Arabidopsis halleri]